jgi:hypothetical protein
MKRCDESINFPVDIERIEQHSHTIGKFASHARPPPLSPFDPLDPLNLISVHPLLLQFSPLRKGVSHILPILRLFSLYYLVVLCGRAVNEPLETLPKQCLADQTGVR